MSDLIICDDGLVRPVWAAMDEMHRDYYDNEWGVRITDEQGIFERMSLEAFQSGLSWSLILRKRPRFREVFANFDPDRVARFDEAKVEELLQDGGIVRNRAKILATINNAQRVIELRANGGLSKLVWSYEPSQQPRPTTFAEIGVHQNAVSLSKDLRKKGFKFVGPTTAQSMMEAIGILNHHLIGSHRRPV